MKILNILVNTVDQDELISDIRANLNRKYTFDQLSDSTISVSYTSAEQKELEPLSIDPAQFAALTIKVADVEPVQEPVEYSEPLPIEPSDSYVEPVQIDSVPQFKNIYVPTLGLNVNAELAELADGVDVEIHGNITTSGPDKYLTYQGNELKIPDGIFHIYISYLSDDKVKVTQATVQTVNIGESDNYKFLINKKYLSYIFTDEPLSEK